MDTSSSPAAPRIPGKDRLSEAAIEAPRDPDGCRCLRKREFALFNLAIDSKLRACDLTRLLVQDICHGDRVATRATVTQQKTHRPVQFELTEQTRESVNAWIRIHRLGASDYLFQVGPRLQRIFRRDSTTG